MCIKHCIEKNVSVASYRSIGKHVWKSYNPISIQLYVCKMQSYIKIRCLYVHLHLFLLYIYMYIYM